jgi:hypothetical protein
VGRKTRRVAVALVLALALLPARALPDPGVYEPGVDPTLGFNLISWWNFGASGAAVWEAAVQDVYDHGFRAVSISPLRFVKLSTGEIRLSDGTTTGPDTAHLAAGIARARALGMSVTVNPFVEPDSFSTWRGQMNFGGAAKVRFWSDYQAYLVEIASAAEASGADRMTVGTELNALVEDASHNADWGAVIAAVGAVFDGQLGYASNWDDYRHANLTATIWEHPQIDFMGVDTYVPLATNTEAAGVGNPAVATLAASWQRVLDDPAAGFAHGIVPFAAARKGGAGMPFIMTEHGTIPYDKTTVTPWSAGPAGNPPDPYEQRNDYEALARAADQRRAAPVASGRLEEIHVWQWGMPGADGSLFFLDPEGDDVTTGAKAAQFLSGFVTGMVPDPGDPQDAEQQRCVNALNESLAGVARAEGLEVRRCVRDGARGQLAPLTVEDCLTADRRGKVAKAKARTVAAEAASCAVSPDFGATGAPTVNQAAVDGGVALIHAVVGPDLQQGIIGEAADPEASRCQQAVSRAVTRCLDARLKEFNRCKRGALRAGAGSAAALTACLGADPLQRIARSCDRPAPVPDRFRRDMAKSCVARGVDLSVAFPPCASADAETVHGCLGAAVAREACLMLDTADGLGADCD